MSGVITAIAGSAVLGAYVSTESSKRASKAASSGASTSADATVESTQMQIDELGRQFDFQMAVLMPQLQQQYNAQGAFGDLLGITADNPTPQPMNAATSATTLPNGARTTDTSGRNPLYGTVPGQPSNFLTTSQAGTSQFSRGRATTSHQGFVDQLLGQQIGIAERAGYTPGDRSIEEGARRTVHFLNRMKNEGHIPDSFEVPSVLDLMDEDTIDRVWGIHGDMQAFLPEGKVHGTAQQALDNPDMYYGISDAVALMNETGGVDQVFASTTDPDAWAAQNGGGGVPLGRNNNNQSFARGADGQFIDPNLNQTRMADVSTYGNTVRDNLLAGDFQNDLVVRNATDNRLGGIGDDLVGRADDVRNAALMLSDDEYFQRVRDGRITTEQFTESPGYAYTIEQMGRELDRKNSAGGNYGGRALMEATRRAEGEAAQEYYNWAALRAGDLDRENRAVENYLGRRGLDINRGDVAAGRQADFRAADQGRMDEAIADYNRRREGDVARLDSAAMTEDQLRMYDIQRGDQGYYNYLNMLSNMAGYGGGAQAEAVNASGNFGNAVANAYGNRGSQLSSIYNNLGQTRAGIALGQGENMNNAIQSGIQNVVTYRTAGD